MIGVNFISIAVVLWLGTSLAEGGNCNCECVGRYGVCEDVSKLRTDVDLNIAERRKWSRYYNFVHDHHRLWEREAAWKEDMEVQMNETTDLAHSYLASRREMDESVQKNIEQLQSVQSDLLTRMRNFETSLETFRKDVNSLFNQDGNFKVTVTNDLSEIKDELLRFRTVCSPPCENGGQCVKNVCNCTSSFTGDRCQEGVTKCGVDFDNGDNNGAGNISDLVWPWMASVYKNGTEHVCYGSVIHRHFVLTTSWCPLYRGDAGLTVKLGLSDLKNGSHVQEYKVRSFHIHPQFRDRGPDEHDNLDYDIGLLEVDDPIQFGPFVRPVCLPPREITGYETFYQPQSSAKAVHLNSYIHPPHCESPTMVNLTVLSQEVCRKEIKQRRWEIFFPTPEFSFCAESPIRCPFRGSPVVQSRLAGDGTRTWTQVSVVILCMDNIIFGYTLGHLRSWVDAIIEPASKQ